MAYLEMIGITKRFANVIANNRAQLEVERGEIHGLLGENGAGKSTLMNILYGLIEPDEGVIRLGGTAVEIHSPKVASSLGIGMVHQHFMLVPNMTVAENIALGQRARTGMLASLDSVTRYVEALSNRYAFRVDPRALVESLSVGVQQRVEILKLLYREAELLIFDEPTAVLSPPEWLDLAEILQTLAKAGKAIVLITHKLDELTLVADRCTVMRDGHTVGTVDMKETDKRSLATMMVGRDVVLVAERPRVKVGEPVLTVQDLDLVDAQGVQRLNGVNFQIRAGEVLGVAGVDGNGQHELIEVLSGMRVPTSGQILLSGEDVTGLSPEDLTVRKCGVIPDDRRRTALAEALSIADNLLMKDHRRRPFARKGVLNVAAMRRHAEQLVADYDVRTTSTDAFVSQLSGGNQQRVVLARELHRQPNLLIAGQPTRGLDVGAMEAVYHHLAEHKTRGGATLLITTELDEVLSLADRIAVMIDGRLTDPVPIDDVDIERVGLLMAGTEA